ncbi:DUF7000 family protein [Thomasclavelia spiroformis]|uniref:DUF7000 family protein n=1 Tax=Thomasclavelia spiroformis TaxID=29348 RepID=UPI00241BE9A0|nr:hypothetical protein [Thomasclavelia spiroformis]MBS6684262.1 hypothetical protein [Thomasclavelia spiroformis]
MKKDIQKSIEIYKEQLDNGYIQVAYLALTKYVAELKSNFPKEYRTGNISFGYLDYTYFSFFNTFLRDQKLRFRVVLNHRKMQIELWLMGQNANIQKKYWEILKKSKWNSDRNKMPRYSVLEVVLENQIDFNNKKRMTENIITQPLSLSQEIQQYLKRVE